MINTDTVLMARGNIQHVTAVEDVERWEAYGYTIVDAAPDNTDQEAPEESGAPDDTADNAPGADAADAEPEEPEEPAQKRKTARSRKKAEEVQGDE